MGLLIPSIRGVLLAGVTCVIGMGAGNAPTSQPNSVAGSTSRYCGLFCAYAALKLHGIDLNFEGLLKAKYIGSIDGSSLSELKGVLEDRGLHAVLARNLTPKALRQHAMPAILLVKSFPDESPYDHFILYGGDVEGNALIFDPPRPARMVPYSDLGPRWGGIGIIVSKRPIRLRQWSVANVAGVLVLAVMAACARLIYLGRSASETVQVNLARVLGGACVICSIALAAGAIANVWMDMGLFARPGVAASTGLHAELLPTITAAEALGSWQRQRGVFIDARLKHDFDAGHISGAISIPVNSTASKRETLMAAIPRDARIVVYCQNSGCDFANKLGIKLKADGYEDVVTYRGGWEQWKALQDQRTP